MSRIQNFSKIFKEYLKNGKNEQKNLFSPWPKDGTFDVAACESMGLRIRDHKPKDKSKKRQRKRELEFKVLSLFENEGLRYRRNLKEGVAALKREPVEMDKSNQHSFIKQHDPAGLYPTLSGVVNIQGDFEMKDHITPRPTTSHPEPQIATSSRHIAPQPGAVPKYDQDAERQSPQYKKSPLQKAFFEDPESAAASATACSPDHQKSHWGP